MSGSLLETIGNTPLIQLKLSQNLPATVWVKLESKNPGGSIKDRVAKFLLERALHDGCITQKTPIIESTSGNMGIGLALVAKQLGLHCILTMPESMSVERRKLLKALGAELVLTKGAQGMQGAVYKAKDLAESLGGYIPGQFTNPWAIEAHYRTTGPEIWQQLEHKVDVLVAGVGSGSSLMGTGRYLKEQNNKIKAIALEPASSPVLSGGKPNAHGIQGIGANFIPKIINLQFFDGILQVADEEAISMARTLCQEEGIICGISSGANVACALKLAQDPALQGNNIVTFICDTGERYLSTALFN